MVVRHDVKVEAIGQMAELPPDLSPLQIGAHGEFDGLAFTLIGRVRLVYEEGSWNEWCALFSDGRYGWVAEAQGLFMVSFETAPPPGLLAPDAMICGRSMRIGQESLYVTDRKETACLGSEGELPFAAAPGRKALSIDLAGAGDQFANLEYSDTGTRFFSGRYVPFDDLKLTNLRPVPGWSEDAAQEPTRHQDDGLELPEVRRGGRLAGRRAQHVGHLRLLRVPDRYGHAGFVPDPHRAGETAHQAEDSAGSARRLVWH